MAFATAPIPILAGPFDFVALMPGDGCKPEIERPVRIVRVADFMDQEERSGNTVLDPLARQTLPIEMLEPLRQLDEQFPIGR